MNLREVATLLGIQSPAVELEIESLCYDSRLASPGALFFCLRGAESDGHRFAAKAVAAGCVALVVEEAVAGIDADTPQLVVADSRRALAAVSEAFFGYPHRQLRMVGLTGTNGKTTTTHLIRQILEQNGRKTGLMGTNHILIGEEILPANTTTPESYEVSSYLRRMVDAGCVDAVMEVSSHGLKQGRVAGIDFDVAVFTNLTQDHLDYHGDFEDYLASKRILFETLREGSRAAVNIDAPYAKHFVDACPVPCKTFGIRREADFRATAIEMDSGGTHFELLYEGKNYAVQMPLLGQFNVYNALAAIGALEALGIPLPDSIAGLAKAEQVHGRFERVMSDRGPTVLVDYAHSPDGLKNILTTANDIKKGRLILVFGCGGDRDRDKRPKMGKIGGEMADFSVITSDNPRTEDPAAIVAMVEEGMKQSGGEYVAIVDRREAIGEAIRMANEEDIVVIAGKGHEDYQILGKTKIHFDDFEEAEAALKLRK